MHEQNREFPLCNQDPRVAGQQGGNSRRCWSSGPWSGRASKTNGKKNWVFFSSFAGGAYGIEILSDATAAESLGFVKNQTAGVFGAFTADDVFGGDLDIVATNTPPDCADLVAASTFSWFHRFQIFHPRGASSSASWRRTRTHSPGSADAVPTQEPVRLTKKASEVTPPAGGSTFQTGVGGADGYQ